MLPDRTLVKLSPVQHQAAPLRNKIIAALRSAMTQYIAEENGHEQWILEDLRACGDDADAAQRAAPAPATELLVAYVYVWRRGALEWR